MIQSNSKTKCSFGRLDRIFQSMEINNRLCNESDESESADLGNLSDESSDEILSEIETARDEPMDEVKKNENETGTSCFHGNYETSCFKVDGTGAQKGGNEKADVKNC